MHEHEINHRNEQKLWWVLLLIGVFFAVEIVGSFITGSLALLSDAVHMSTDALALFVSLMAIRFSRKPADAKRTYGYNRFEVIAALFNCLLLIALAFFVFYKGYQRFVSPTEIHSEWMLVIAIAGLLVNIIALRVLGDDHGHNVNMKSARLEVLADLVSSVGVIIAAGIVWLTHWQWVDALVAIGIGLWVLPRAFMVLKESVHILLEGVPHDVDVDAVRVALSNIEGVEALHDLHVWSLTPKKVTLTVHLVSKEPAQHILNLATQLLAKQFGIYHVAIQVEQEPCAMTRNEHEHYSPSHPMHD